MSKMFEKMSSGKKTAIAMCYDGFSCLFFLFASLFIRLGEAPGDAFYTPKIMALFFFMGASQFITLYFNGLYRGIWRYSSTPDLVRLIKGVTTAVLISFLVAFFFNRLENIPRTFFLIDWLLLVVGLGGGRLGYRLFRENILSVSLNGEDRTGVVILGAGAAGEQLVREIKRSPNLGMFVAGFVDDDRSKKNKFLHGVEILGGVEEVQDILYRTNSKCVIIAIPSANNTQMDRILKYCKGDGIEIKTLPHTSDVLSREINFSQVRDVGVEDLLGRQETTLDRSSISKMLTQTKVMVTGAGGSIGSELCAQIAKFNPSEIIFYEMGEFNLYKLESEFKSRFPNVNYRIVIGDVRDEAKVDKVVRSFRPNVIFHAAAYKHVPLMEANPAESVHTNVFGTKVVASIASRYEVDKFVLVSTDKAVRPTNVMGATKRIAEIVCQQIQKKSNTTKFMIVRFGNVLGSSGSVVPLFKKQISAGGPITVTHPEITRYFMTIPEACQLVMQAGAVGKGGEVFVLDMGEPVKIVDLAKQMISLSGLTEDDIKIEFSGLRPGEKLYEELLLDGEGLLPTIHPLVKVAKVQSCEEGFEGLIESLWGEVTNGIMKNDIKRLIKKIVPEYVPMIEEKTCLETSTDEDNFDLSLQ
jgi:FlaA1/EpsC-like NDP-sugar epimerase